MNTFGIAKPLLHFMTFLTLLHLLEVLLCTEQMGLGFRNYCFLEWRFSKRGPGPAVAPLGTGYRCTFSGPTPGLVKQKLWKQAQQPVLSQALHVMLTHPSLRRTTVAKHPFYIFFSFGCALWHAGSISYCILCTDTC